MIHDSAFSGVTIYKQTASSREKINWEFRRFESERTGENVLEGLVVEKHGQTGGDLDETRPP